MSGVLRETLPFFSVLSHSFKIRHAFGYFLPHLFYAFRVSNPGSSSRSSSIWSCFKTLSVFYPQCPNHIILFMYLFSILLPLNLYKYIYIYIYMKVAKHVSYTIYNSKQLYLPRKPRQFFEARPDGGRPRGRPGLHTRNS